MKINFLNKIIINLNLNKSEHYQTNKNINPY